MKKDNKQRLFEVMGKLDKTFKPRLNEGTETENPTEYQNPEPKEDNQVKEFLKKQLNILDWDSSEGAKKREQVANTAMNAAQQIEETIKSSINNAEKAKKVQTIITASGILSTLIGLWQLLTNTHRVTYGLWEKFSNWVGGGNPLTNHIEWGGKFFLTLAAFLLILKFIHMFLRKGFVIKEEISKIWNYIRSVINAIIGKNKMQESFTTDEYNIVQEMLEYNF
jgi:hypothetical protein